MTELTWQDEIRRVEEEGRVAFLARDLERLRRLWSEDLAVNSPLNRINKRAQLLELLERGVIAHISFEQHIELITRHGEVVVVMGYDVVQNKPDEPPATRRFTDVWREEQAGSWRLIARQATIVPA
jgi:ketosteroid isomerase-like protein